MALVSIRWNSLEASKPYARPFGVGLDGSSADPEGMVAVNGAELMYLRHFQIAVLRLTGRLFHDAGVEGSADPQRAWLDRLAALLPPLPLREVAAASRFDDQTGRLHHFRPGVPDCPWAEVEAAQLVEYQDFQAALAHQTGRLYRDPAIEAIDEPARRQAAWLVEVTALLERGLPPR
ncbi:MAG: hypothetical protein ABR541_09475 [Candidatus Dormibacteria bacterium]